MLSAFPGIGLLVVLLVAAEMRMVEAVQPEATPRQVSFRKIFCVVPGVSAVLPSGEARTNTPKRWLALSTGKESDPPGTFVRIGEPGVYTENGSLFEAPGPGVVALI